MAHSGVGGGTSDGPMSDLRWLVPSRKMHHRSTLAAFGNKAFFATGSSRVVVWLSLLAVLFRAAGAEKGCNKEALRERALNNTLHFRL